MKCQVCQSDILPGSTFCTNCGTPLPSAAGGSPSSPNQGIAPTVLASTPPPPNPYGTPSTDYGSSPTPPPAPYGAAPSNPYEASTPNPYGASSSSPYGTPPPANPYGAPPSSPYGAPPAYNPGVPGAFGQPPYTPPKKKGPNGCVIAIVIVLALVVLIGGGLAVLVGVVFNKAKGVVSNLDATSTAIMATANADLTPSGGDGTTPTTGTTASGLPSASQINPSAAANLKNAQTSSSVDSNYEPTHVTSVFTSSDTIYITYKLSGKAGYVIEKTYDNLTKDIVVQSQSPHKIDSGDTNGYISFTSVDAGSYTTGLFWCNQSDCSDAALAGVVTFSVA